MKLGHIFGSFALELLPSTLPNFHSFVLHSKIIMATYSPPTTPQLDTDVCEDLLRHLNEQIQATQQRHVDAQRQLQKERRQAIIHQPGQFENAEEQTNTGVIQHIQQDYSFNLTGISPPQPPKWRQVDHLYEDFKKFRRSCTCVFDGPTAHVSDKVKVNMLLLWCGPDGEDIYEGFNLPEHQQYDLALIWTLFDRHCEPICNKRDTIKI